MAINIGTPAIDRPDNKSWEYTRIAFGNPAPFDGIITTVEIYTDSGYLGAIVGSFSRDGDKLTARDWANLGNVAGGSKQVFPDLTIEVHAGDHIGICGTAGTIDVDLTGGEGTYVASGNRFDGNEHLFSFFAGRTLSLGGWIGPPPLAPAKRSYGFIIG